MDEIAFALLLIANAIALVLLALLWLQCVTSQRRLLRRIDRLEEIVCPRVELRVAMIRADKAEPHSETSNWMQ
jgi:uncharacterized membrane protein YciS (DUF1049 family)